ncbi:MAG: NUDIX domain-containing protein [Bacilli bacterium]|nr:NUDIX domain-containing protein [Bacilli bacterium]
MKTKVLSIAVIEHEGKILMRKKPAGSVPYKETWYCFGGEVKEGISPDEAVKSMIKKQTGIEIDLKENLGWDTEIKKDLDGEEKQFIYLDSLYTYLNGDLKIGEKENIEKLEWIPIEKLSEYDFVPPSIIFFKKIGYLK